MPSRSNSLDSPIFHYGATPNYYSYCSMDTTIPVRGYSSKKEEQLLRRRVRERARRAAETAEEKEQRLSKRRARDKARRAEQRAEQHAEERKKMLQQLRCQQQERRDAETGKQREDRLQQLRCQQQERRDAETGKQREDRLQYMRDQEHERRDTESSSQRENRLQHMRDEEHERRDAESSAQRENRLQHMRDEEHERRDAESSAQRENRLQHMRDQEHERRDAEVLPWPSSSGTPINEFTTEGYMSCAFPSFFPTGAADFVAPRPRTVTIGNYFKHLMQYHDGRFAKHPRFRYFALNTEMRHRALQTGRIYVRQNPHDDHLSIDELRDMIGREGEVFSN